MTAKQSQLDVAAHWFASMGAFLVCTQVVLLTAWIALEVLKLNKAAELCQPLIDAALKQL